MNNLRNQVQLIGNLGSDVELKKLDSGNQVAHVNIATNESYKKNDEWVKETQWHRLVAWGKTAEKLTSQAQKGSEVAIQGKLKYGSYEDKNGNKITYAEIVVNDFLVTGSKKEKVEAVEEKQPF